jgi:hypothetical protein
VCREAVVSAATLDNQRKKYTVPAVKSAPPQELVF